MSTRNKILISSVTLILIVVGIFVVISARKRNQVVVQTGRVTEKELLESRVSASGEIRPKNYVELQAEIAGVITYLAVREGDHVAKGDILLRIDPIQSEADLRAQQAIVDAQSYDAASIAGQIAIGEANLQRDQASLEAAQAEFKQAENDFERGRAKFKRKQQLHEENLLSHEEYETAKNELAAAEAKSISVRSNLRRAEAQVNVSRVTLKQASEQYRATTSRVEQAKALLRKTQDLLSKTVIRSPLTGIITKLNVEVGERAVPGTLNNPAATLMEIADMSVIEAEIQVDETDIVNVKAGQPTKVTVDAVPDAPLKGVVTEVGNSAITSGLISQTQASQGAKDFKVVVQLIQPPPTLRPGLSATAEITTATKKNVLTIPIQSLTIREVDVDAQDNYHASKREDESKVVSADGDGRTRKKELQGVFVVSHEGKAIFRPVETGIASEMDVEVKKGLSKEEEIVTGSYKILRNLKDGDPVRVDNSARARAGENS